MTAGPAWSGTTAAALAALAVAAAMLLLPDPVRVPRSGVPGRVPDQRARRLLLPAGVVVAGVLIAPAWWWVGLLAGIGIAAGRLLASSRGSPRRRAARRRLLIGHAELLAAGLDSGLTTAAALHAVGDALRSRPLPDGAVEMLTALDAVGAMLTLGADAETAWRAVDTDEDLAPLAAAARRSVAGGTTLADAVREHGRQVREEVRQDATRSAGRAGVAMTAPLAVCFLPAFLCLGLAPVVLGLLDSLSIF